MPLPWERDWGQQEASPFRDSIASIESAGSGDYGALGPRTRKGDRAYGRYQVMGANIGPWTEKYLGRRLTPEQFLADQDAQDRVFDGEFGSYVQKYGPAGAARAWFAGEGGMNDASRRDAVGTSVADYERKFMRNAPQQEQAAGPKPWERQWAGAEEQGKPLTPDMEMPELSIEVDNTNPRKPLNYASAGAGDIASEAGANLIPSAKRFGQDMLGIVTDPVGTVTNIKNVAAGAVEKLRPGEQEHEKYADAVGKFFMDRYGGVENLKRTMAEDPVGFLADAATLLSGGELALARAPGVAGQIGRAVGEVGRAVDPINASLRVAKVAGKGVGNVGASLGGVVTGTGGTVLRQSAKTGFEGGEAGKAFRENMRGNVPMEAVLTDAKAALQNIRDARGKAYNSGMADVRGDTKVLDFGAIEKSLNNAKTQFTFKGVTKNPKAAAAIQEVATILDEWKKYDPAEFHTAEGFDALKQRIGSVLEGLPFEQREARTVVGQIYNAVKGQIARQAPTYAKTMSDYQKASEIIKEIEKTLSLNPRANVDTALRKLQSVMRNNVNTNYGRRADLAKMLEDNGAKNLLAKLAGQSAASWAPRGLARLVAGLQTAGGASAAFASLNPAVLLPTIGTLAMQSPRIVGEATHAGGRAAKGLSRLPARKALQSAYSTRGE